MELTPESLDIDALERFCNSGTETWIGAVRRDTMVALLAAVRERDAAVERAEEESSLRRDAESSRDYAEARAARLTEALDQCHSVAQMASCDFPGAHRVESIAIAALASSPRVLARGWAKAVENDPCSLAGVMHGRGARYIVCDREWDGAVPCIVVALDAREEVSDGA